MSCDELERNEVPVPSRHRLRVLVAPCEGQRGGREALALEYELGARDATLWRPVSEQSAAATELMGTSRARPRVAMMVGRERVTRFMPTAYGRRYWGSPPVGPVSVPQRNRWMRARTQAIAREARPQGSLMVMVAFMPLL